MDDVGWEQKQADLRRTVDGLGQSMDDGIIDTVVALQLLGYHTVASCEGHADWGVPYPWVDIATENEPVRFATQRPANDTQDSPDWTLWRERNIELTVRLKKLVRRFYSHKNRLPMPHVAVMVMFAGHEPRIIVTDGMRKRDEKTVENIINKKLQPSPDLVNRLHARQRELKRFTDFLKSGQQ